MTRRHTKAITKAKNVADNVVVAVFWGVNSYARIRKGNWQEINNFFADQKQEGYET